MNRRQRWLVLALIATVTVAFWPDRKNGGEVVEAARQADKSTHTAAPAAGGDSEKVAPVVRERLASMQANIFPKQTWAPPPKPYIPPPPPPPQPPPLPFKYLGRWTDAGKQTLFLVQGDLPIPVEPGQVLSGGWRVDEITEKTVVFTYLPLNMQSILGITL